MAISHVIPQSLIKEWNKALEESVPKRSQLHTRNKALFLLWEDASHGRRDDAVTLKRLLCDRYRFEGETFFIPLDDSQDALQKQILDFSNPLDNSSSLALIYYSGNGSVKHGRPLWLPDSKLQPEIDWFSLQESLETSPSDVVLLFDCGYCTGAPRESDVRSCLRTVSPAPTGGMEILSTPGGMSADDATFRKALINTLTGISGESVRIDQLRRKIHRALGGAALDPPYANISRSSDRSSIVILPSEKVNLDLVTDRRLNSGNQQGLKVWADRAPWQIKTFKFLDPEEQGGDDGPKRISAVVDVAKQSDLSEKNVSSWIKLAPPYVVGINNQGSVLSSGDKTGDERLSGIVQVWNQSSGFRTNLNTRDGEYTKIVVLPMKWEQDGFEDKSMISQELRDLCGVLETSLEHCEIKPMFEIPSVGELQTAVTKKIMDVKEGLGSTHLLVVLYNGHGIEVLGQGSECILSGQGQDAAINWNVIQPLLHEAPCDVAQILDCCFAGNATKSKPQGKNEILAACEKNVRTPTGDHSYMKRFTAALKQLVDDAKPFSLLQVHERVRAETERHNAQMQRDDPRLPSIALPVHKLIPENSGSITLRPRILETDPKQKAMHGERTQDRDGFLGYAYAKVQIYRGDERREWKDVGFVKILTAEETMKELRADS